MKGPVENYAKWKICIIFFSEVLEFLHVVFKLMQKHGPVFFPLVFALCLFPISICFRLGNAGWYCITKSSIFSHAALFFCFSADFLSKNFTSGRCFLTTLAGYPLSFRRNSKNFS